MDDLLTAWSSFQFPNPPYVLPGDDIRCDDKELCCRYDSWKAYTSDPNSGEPGRHQLHLSLLPMPFVGNLTTGSIFLLMLNPGFGPHDYFGEYELPDFHKALCNNLHQAPNSSFMFIDPKFSWHGGFRYWHGKLQELMADFARQADVAYGDARRFFQSQIASLELVPYHSVSLNIPSRMFRNWRSVQLVKRFVKDNLLPRAQRGACLLVVLRAAKHWEAPKGTNVVRYSPAEARSAHLGPNSRAGKIILKFLLDKYKITDAE